MSESLLARVEALEALFAAKPPKPLLIALNNTEVRIPISLHPTSSNFEWGIVQSASSSIDYSDRPKSEWRGLDVRARNCLKSAGFIFRGEVLYAVDNGFNFNKIPNFGKKSNALLIEWLNTPISVAG